MDQFPSTPHPCSKPRLNVGTQTYASLGRSLLGTFQGFRRQAYRDDSPAIVLGNFAKDFLIFVPIQIFLGPFPCLIPSKRDDFAAATTRVCPLGNCIFCAGTSAAKKEEFSAALSKEALADVVEVTSVPCIAPVANQFCFFRVIALTFDNLFHVNFPCIIE